MRGVAGLGGWSVWAHRAGSVDVADLFGPGVIFGHEGESAIGTQPPDPGDAPAGFFKTFAVKCGQWGLAGVNAAAGKLEFPVRVGLVGQKDIAAPGQDDVDARSEPIAPPGFPNLAVSAHGIPLARPFPPLK